MDGAYLVYMGFIFITCATLLVPILSNTHVFKSTRYDTTLTD